MTQESTKRLLSPSKLCTWGILAVLLASVALSNAFKLYDGYYNSLFRPVVEQSFKAKVETLGAILKRHVQQLRSAENRQVDLVFLVDSSASVGGRDFQEEIKFVRKLLADFTVDMNSTRVAVITFSSREKVVRQVDHLSRPDSDNHKCSLLVEQIPRIRYVGGGTFTLGAFLEAKKVLKAARQDAVKAVFLITDGFSNGGDPRPEARRLRQQGVKIFTFGIRNGNVRELWEMASEPRNETCYVLDSFEEFEALARRALHSDLHSGTYIPQAGKKCSRLCDNEGFCCHANASCTCGTHTGKYECLCKPGHYGNGLGKDGCKPCPSGTYKNHTGSGDESVCSKCPDENQETLPGATLVHECRCKRGFRNFNSSECTVFRCPELKEPENGYFVNNQCNNVFNAACGLRCRPGYELRGSGLRICQEDGVWSGQDTKCVLKTCPALPSPKHGHMVCTTDDFRYPTVCRFTCQAGYQLVGSRKRSCLAIAFWTGIAARCREISCPPLTEIRDGSIQPALCTDGEVPFGTRCQLSCLRGYKLLGPNAKQCTPDGTWSATSRDTSQCIDKTPPYIQCPNNIKMAADADNDTAKVTWAVPVPVDNSGFLPVLTADPAVVPPANFPIGITIVTYRAEDLTENVAKCKFYILIIDETPPRVDECFSPDPVVSPGSKEVKVSWKGPVFSDNSGKAPEVQSSHTPGQAFPLGHTVVTYTAFDNDGNNSTCTIDVHVLPHSCQYPKPPVNGKRKCYESEEGVHCVLSCDPGHAFVVAPPPEYFCAYDNVWTPADRLPFPDCAAQQISNEVLQPASITLTGDLSCAEHKFLNRVEQNIEAKVNDKVSSLCEDNVECEMEQIQTTCDEIEDFNKINLVTNHRLRRAANARLGNSRRRRASIKFDFTLEGTVNSSRTPREAARRQKELSQSMKRLLNGLQAQAKQGQFDLYLAGRWLRFSDMDFDARRQRSSCPEGAILINNTCVLCPVGMFYNVVSHACGSCPKGTYQPSEGRLTCLVCPEKTSTTSDHSRSEGECTAQCLPGSVSATGLERCETCLEGFYQSQYARTKCTPCPEGSTTLRRGARGKEFCRERCQPGLVSRTGLSPCYPCPHGTYQPVGGQTVCIRCPGDADTDQRASTSISQCRGLLELQNDDAGSYQAQQQVMDANECFTNPCRNGAICIPQDNGLFDCICRRGFEGVFCQIETDQCEARPCLNGGTCAHITGSYRCDCPPGFEGQKCERDLDECLSSPCRNGGTCVDGANAFTCNCVNGYQGVTCESDVNDCEADPCLNGGTCEDDVSGYRCTCPVGFSGTTCEIEADECLSNPCQHGGTCVDEPSAFRCECVAGYTGEQCQEEVDECRSAPCQNGARCQDLLNAFRCHCKDGYTGTRCEAEVNTHYQLDFPVASTVDYAMLDLSRPLSALTVSFWMLSDDYNNYGTAFSYAVPNMDNALTLVDYNGFAFYVNQESVVTDVATNDGLWHHVVITWSSVRGIWKIYVDGLLNDSGFDLSTARPIPGKGKLVIGQEQDSMGGGFSANEAFVGSITRFNIWDEELSLEVIMSMRTSCFDFHGNVVAWPDIQESLRGSLSAQPSAFCQDCPVPADIEFGFVNYTTLTPGSNLEFSCMRGFNVAGPDSTVCLITGEYELPSPSCQRVDCGNPGSINNGYYTGWQFTFDNRVRFKCQRGYTLRGQDTLYCNEYGEWEGNKPECNEIMCELPSLSENTLLLHRRTTPFKPKEVATFHCATGHRLLTTHDSVTCQSDGTWDRSVPTCDAQTCSTPPSILFGEADSNREEYSVGDIVRYLCDFGYTLDPQGSNPTGDISCLPTGQWTRDMPQCVLVSCGEPPLVAHASMDGEERTFLARVTYECYPGYAAEEGTETIECLETGSWDPEPPTCLPVDCGPPPELVNGQVDGSEFTFNAVVTCSCKPGYKLVGDMRRRCNESGRWEGPDPVCKPVSCGRLADPNNGRVTAPLITFLGEAVYECNEGYNLEGEALRLCMEDAQWTGAEPTCSAVTCEALPDIENGSYQGPALYTFGARVVYTCQQGYEMQGQAELLCRSNGFWSDEVPVCVPVQCPVPGQPDHGTATALGLIYTSKVEYTCDDGYSVEGDTVRTCEADGAWSGEETVCKPITCQPPPDIDNGHYNYKDLKIGSIVHYVCDVGFRLDGDEIRRCRSDLTLSGVEPTCVPVSCPNPALVQQGSFTLSDTVLIVGSSVSYTCDTGHVMVGESVRTCGADGTLSGASPLCRPVECNKPAEIISNGRMLGSSFSFNSTIGYVCDEGYRMEGLPQRTCQANGQWSSPIPVCIVVECPRPSIVNGQVSTFRRGFGTVVTFTCRRRHRLEGPAQRTCLADGTWSGDDPVCVKVICPPPGALENGESRQVSDTRLEHACHDGFRLLGSNYSTCNELGAWEPFRPSCERITCPDLSGATLHHGLLLFPEDYRHYGNEVQYVCEEGYNLIGLASRRCRESGQWEGESPVCEIVSCPPPEPPANGGVLGDLFTFQSDVSFECDEGYELIGESMHRCQNDGTWEYDAPVCRIISCPPPTGITNGRVLGDVFTFQSDISYECHEGYELLGESMRRCQSDKTWEFDTPVCEIVSCPQPDAINFGRVIGDVFTFQSEISYECNEGHELTGENTRKCLSDKTWNFDAPTCEIISCPQPDEISNGHVLGDIFTFGADVSYECNEGYELIGESMRRCQSDKTWEFDAPTCEIISCPQPDKISNGRVLGDTFTFGADISYECNEGYELTGESMRRCQSDKNWEFDAPTCEIISCPQPDEISNGHVLGDIFTFGADVSYECNEGYELTGESMRRCQSNKTWEFDAPTCEIVFCPQPDEVTNGRVIGDTFTFGADVSYECNEGYELIGESVRRCQSDKTWEFDAPTCEIVYCPQPDEIANGYVFGDTFTFGADVGYECNKGYELIGEGVRLCQSDKTWEFDAPTCEIISCPQPDEISNGHVLGDIFTFGADVSYECNEGYELIGESMRRCQSDKTWEFDAPTCEIIFCPQPDEVTNGRVIGDTFTFGADVSYECNDGYELIGENTRRCQSDKTWEFESPTCEIISCPQPDEITNGRVLGDVFTFQSEISYECNGGYELLGESVRRCLSDRTWEFDTPACRIMYCPQPDEIANGRVLGDTFTFGADLSYECNEGYELIGESMRRCQSDKTWEFDAPTCEIVSCSQPIDIDNGRVLGDIFTFGADISYECNEGYELAGERMRRCQFDKTWEFETPTCEIISCPNPDDIPNGRVLGDVLTFQSDISYECNEGYALVGESKRRCQSDKTWEFHAPVCEIISCLVPLDIPNGRAIGDDFRFNTDISYECDEGYYLTGQTRQRCLADGTWEGEQPFCEPVSCPEIDTVFPNGAVTVESNLFGGRMRYSCFPGFSIRGGTSRECLASGQWSGSEPVCVALKCPEITPIDHGYIVGDDYMIGRTVMFGCDKGFQIVGPMVSVCLPNLLWSSGPPRCERISCPELPPLIYGTSIGDVRQYEDEVEFMCDAGHELLGDYTIRCQADGAWSGEVPECFPVSCGLPPLVDNAISDLANGTLFPAAMTYICDTGYRAEGSGEASCQADGTWSLPSLVCQLVTCQEIIADDLPHGSVRGFDFSFGEVVHFSCDEGYRLSGSDSAACTAGGYWNSEIPVCNLVTCSEPDQIFQASVTVEGYDFNQTATYQCNVGFRFKGEPVARCTASGEWSSEFRACELVACERPPDTLPHGRLVRGETVYFYEDYAEYACDLGYELVGTGRINCTADGVFVPAPPTCAKIKCPSPETPTHGVVNILNDTLIYSCNPGYELTGDPRRPCLPTGDWEGVAPVCIPILCPPPPPVDNGGFMGIDFQFGRAVSYYCDTGFTLQGSSSRTCLASRSWSGKEPTCQRVSCGAPSPVEFGSVSGEDFTYNGTVTYECRIGFALVGPDTRTCLETGAWSLDEPFCDEISCEEPPDVINATHDATNPSAAFLYGFLVMYTCDYGHVMTGASSTICQEDGKWSQPLPRCPPVTCPELLPLDNGDLEGDDATFGEEFRVTCAPGYRLIGPYSVVCMGDGQWDAALPKCQQIRCSLPVIENGHTAVEGQPENTPTPTTLLPGQDVVFHCLPGFRIEGNNSSTCLEDETWTSVPPSCPPVLCDAPPAVGHSLASPASSYQAGDSVTYTCELGYELEGDATLLCGNDGLWAGAAPICVDVVCDAPPVVEHAVAKGPEDSPVGRVTPAGGWATYQCEEGFALADGHDGRVRCLRGGVWSSDLPRCSHVDCGAPPVPHHAYVTAFGTTAGSLATVTCNRGHTLPSGGKRLEVICDISGSWVGAENARCLPVSCPQPPDLDNAFPFIQVRYKYKDSVTYQCMPGHYLVGEGRLNCSDSGDWVGVGENSTSPFCAAVSCGPPNTDALVVGSDFTFGQLVVLACPEGSRLVGQEVITCTAAGKWSAQPGICEKITCPDLAIPLNGYVFSASREGRMEAGDQVELLCNEGFSLVGEPVVTCLPNGTWSTSVPSCELIRDVNKLCLDTVHSEHAAAPAQDFFPGDRVVLSCLPGYEPEGDMTSLCQEDRTWSATSGRCRRLSCGPPPVENRQHAKVFGRSHQYGDRVMYMCRPGLSPVNVPPTLTCTHTGQWDGVARCAAQCKSPCENGGRCVGFNKCKCRPGFTGRQCQIPICILPCLNGGKCQGPYRCKCPPGYHGSRCQRAYCGKPCQNGGRCLHPNRCQCFNGFKPPFCESSYYAAKKGR